MITALALAALVAFIASQTKGGAGAGAGPSPAVTADLQKLYAANPQAYAAVNQVLGSGNPAVLIQYAASLNAQYPALAKQLAAMAQSNVTPVTGASGTSWNLWGKQDSAGTSNVDVLLGAAPVLSYSQAGTDKTTRKFLGAATGVDTATLARARADFGV